MGQVLVKDVGIYEDPYLLPLLPLLWKVESTPQRHQNGYQDQELHPERRLRVCVMLLCGLLRTRSRMNLRAGRTGPAGPAAAGPIFLPNHAHFLFNNQYKWLIKKQQRNRHLLYVLPPPPPPKRAYRCNH